MGWVIMPGMARGRRRRSVRRTTEMFVLAADLGNCWCCVLRTSFRRFACEAAAFAVPSSWLLSRSISAVLVLPSQLCLWSNADSRSEKMVHVL
jgi:hypothetical protein